MEYRVAVLRETLTGAELEDFTDPLHFCLHPPFCHLEISKTTAFLIAMADLLILCIEIFFLSHKGFPFLIFKALEHFHAALELLWDPGSVLTVSTEVSLEAGCLVSHDVCQNF